MNKKNNSLPPAHTSKMQKGLSIIEVLIAAFVFSLGILGLSSTQLVGLQASTGTGVRTQAEFLANDMLERMRANRANILDYRIALNAPAPGSPVNVAQTDLNDWKTQIAQTLPDGQGSIDVQSTRAVITLEWLARGESRNSQASTERLVLSSEL